MTIYLTTTLLCSLVLTTAGSFDPDNMVNITDSDNFCLIVPKAAHTNIADSDIPGGTQTYCTVVARKFFSQGIIPDGFWSNVEFVEKSMGMGGGRRIVQLTGCIRPEVLDRLNPDDSGSQYDPRFPEGSTCGVGPHYVELIEPAAKRACIRCCQDADDCPTTMDAAGCPSVVPGNYFNCG